MPWPGFSVDARATIMCTPVAQVVLELEVEFELEVDLAAATEKRWKRVSSLSKGVGLTRDKVARRAGRVSKTFILFEGL